MALHFKQQTLGKHLPWHWHASLGLIFNCAAAHFNWNMKKAGDCRPQRDEPKEERERVSERGRSRGRDGGEGSSLHCNSNHGWGCVQQLVWLYARQSSVVRLGVGLLKHKDNLSCPHRSCRRGRKSKVQLQTDNSNDGGCKQMTLKFTFLCQVGWASPGQRRASCPGIWRLHNKVTQVR